MAKNQIHQLIRLQEILIKLGQVERADYWPGSTRKRNETDIEHSLFLAFHAWQVAVKLQLNLDHGKILKYALTHDLPETYAGDTPLFSGPEKRQMQEKNEQEAIGKLFKNLPDSDIPKTIRQYYRQEDEESKFVNAMDRLSALFVQICSEETQFVDNKITHKHIEDILPSWRKRTDISEEMTEFTNDLLEVWYKSVKLHPAIKD